MGKMVKIRITHHSKSVWLGTRYDRAFGKQCSAPTTFTDACFKGNDPNKNMFPVKIKSSRYSEKCQRRARKEARMRTTRMRKTRKKKRKSIRSRRRLKKSW